MGATVWPSIRPPRPDRASGRAVGPTGPFFFSSCLSCALISTSWCGARKRDTHFQAPWGVREKLTASLFVSRALPFIVAIRQERRKQAQKTSTQHTSALPTVALRSGALRPPGCAQKKRSLPRSLRSLGPGRLLGAACCPSPRPSRRAALV